MPECVFCKIANGEIPTRMIYSSKDLLAFLDIKPANLGHVLVIPRQHYTYLPQIPQELNASLLELIKVLISAEVEALGAEGVNVLQNNGSAAGQIVPHVHFHIIPRFKDDKVVLDWQPLQFKEEQFEEVQKKLIEGAKAAFAKTQIQTSEQRPEEVKTEVEKREEIKGKIIKLKPKHA
ncbi:MAG: HIT family protein [Candidatus Nanoarchaeia archaeon]